MVARRSAESVKGPKRAARLKGKVPRVVVAGAFRATRLAPLAAPRPVQRRLADAVGLTAPSRALFEEAPRAPHRHAADPLDAARREGLLITDPGPAVHTYVIATASGQRTRGLLVALQVGGGTPDGIAGHEGVEPSRLADRVARLGRIPYDLGPVIVVPEDGRLLREALTIALSGAVARVSARHADGSVHHVASASTERSALVTGMLAGTAAVVADGHHRAAAAAARGGGTGELLAWVVDPDEIVVRPIHRRLLSIPPDWRRRLGRVATLLPAPHSEAGALAALSSSPPAAFALVTGGETVLVVPRPELRELVPRSGSDRWRGLGSVLVAHGLGPALGLLPDQLEPDLGDHDAPPTAARVLVRAPAVADVVALALTGEGLPAKSTRFGPKPRTGLVLRRRDQDVPSTHLESVR